MSVDPRVYDLAKLFTADIKDAVPDDAQELAEQIQQTIEDFLVAYEEATQERIAELQEKAKAE